MDRCAAGGVCKQSWWSQSGSNRRPSGCKPDALPAELWPLVDLAEIARGRLALAISADITLSAVGKKRGFCPLRHTLVGVAGGSGRSCTSDLTLIRGAL